MNILLADDHVIIMDGLRSLIARLAPEAHVTQVSDLDALLAYLTHTEVQLVICDINMPGANHFGIVKQIKSVRPHTKLLMLSAYSPGLYAQRYLQEGADAYLNKNVPTEEIGNAILALLQGEAGVGIEEPDETVEPAAGTSPLAALSNRELEVAQLLTEGNGILEIANLLQLHTNTVSTYKARIFEKMNVASIPELVVLFRNQAGQGI